MDCCLIIYVCCNCCKSCICYTKWCLGCFLFLFTIIFSISYCKNCISFWLVLNLVSGDQWKVKYLRERRRSSRLLAGMRQARLDCSAYRSLVRELKRKVSYYKYKWILRRLYILELVITFYCILEMIRFMGN